MQIFFKSNQQLNCTVASLFSVAGSQRATDHVLHAIKTLGADRHPWRLSRLFMRREAQFFNVTN